MGCLDSVTGKISDERYMMFSEDYEAEQKTLRESVKEVAAKLERQKDEALNVGRFMEVVHKYMTFEELTPAMLRELINRIIVHTPHDTGTKKSRLFTTLSALSSLHNWPIFPRSGSEQHPDKSCFPTKRGLSGRY